MNLEKYVEKRRRRAAARSMAAVRAAVEAFKALRHWEDVQKRLLEASEGRRPGAGGLRCAS
jgi:hypothetical protein